MRSDGPDLDAVSGPTGGNIGELIHQLVDDAKAFAQAEVDFLKAQALVRVAPLKLVAILGVAAAVLANAALIALLVGLVLTIAPHFGPGWATLIVVGVTMSIAGLLGYLAYARLTRPLPTNLPPGLS